MVAFLVVGCVLWLSRGACYWIGVSLVVWLFCLALMPEAGGRFTSIESLADKSITHRFDV
jgi:Na+-translocating ferredoxin:NAD+ oxidoreductase RnfD subunit